MGTKIRYIKSFRENATVRYRLEKAIIERRFPCIQCQEVHQKTTALVCEGNIHPTVYSPFYEIRVVYRFSQSPQVYILNPKIEIDAATHFYKEGNLCLFYPKDEPWKSTFRVADKIIPWVAEWLVFYELYKIDGVWYGKSAPHSNI